MIDLLRMRAAFVDLARPSVSYCREHGIDWRASEPHGGLFVAPIAPDGARFDFDPDGTAAAVIEALGPDGETVTDLVAWPLNDPSRVMTAIGAATALGEVAARSPATYFGGSPLRLFRTPLAWLKARCDGAVILDKARGARWLLDVPTGAIAAEDAAHAAELDAMRKALVRSQRILLPVQDAA